MRRLVAVLTVAVMLALVASALAAVVKPKSGWHFKGALNDATGHPISDGKFTDTVTFSISGTNVKNFKFGSAIMCAGGFGGPPPKKNPFTTKTARISSMKIKKAGKVYTFSGSGHGPAFGSATINFTVSGSFAKSGKSASGRVSFTCSSGPGTSLTYRAKKTKK